MYAHRSDVVDSTEVQCIHVRACPLAHSPALSSSHSGFVDMATNTAPSMCWQESMRAAFWRRFKRYLRSRHQLSNNQAGRTLGRLHGANYDGDDSLVLN